MRTILASLLVLAACGGSAVCGGCGDGDPIEALPDSFRIVADVVEVTGADGQPGSPGSERCTPGEVDRAWTVGFSRFHDAEEPTFAEDTNTDSASYCQTTEADCCRPVVLEDGAAVLRCDGRPDPFGRNSFEFRFGADGSGSGTATRFGGLVDPALICISRFSWSAVVPVE
jgi:hypothetical protein